MTKEIFEQEFLARTLDKKLGINKLDDVEKNACNESYAVLKNSTNNIKYPYFEAYKEGYMAAIGIVEDIFCTMMNQTEDLTKE